MNGGRMEGSVGVKWWTVLAKLYSDPKPWGVANWHIYEVRAKSLNSAIDIALYKGLNMKDCRALRVRQGR